MDNEVNNEIVPNSTTVSRSYFLPLIICVVLLILSVAGNGYFLFRNITNPKQMITEVPVPTEIPVLTVTIKPTAGLVSVETEISMFTDKYMQAVVSEDWVVFKSLLTKAVQPDFDVNLAPIGVGGYKIVSISEPDKSGNYYVTVNMTNRKTGDKYLIHNQIPKIMVRKEDGEWKSLTMQIFE